MKEKNIKYNIFISYRRKGTDAHARVFYEKLKELGYSVFLDFESLGSGRYQTDILNYVANCTDFIVLIPEDGLERCHFEDDLFRREIREALNSEVNIIPILVNGFEMPTEDELPSEISALSLENGIACSMEYFDAVFKKVVRNLHSRPEDDYLFDVLGEMKNKVLSLNHSYFKKWASIKIGEFLMENEMFFQGTNWTNPHAEDTFGVSGIEFSQKTVKALTTVSDYWNDDFTKEYLKKQCELIEKGIEIYRVFVIENGEFEKAKEQMQQQKNMGIKVYYIEKDNKYIDPDWLKEDYLIQDDELLVEIYCSSHQFASKNRNNEQITMNNIKVRQKIERFQRILERAKPLIE